jgi:DNA-nicking Smr family endonuclease
MTDRHHIMTNLSFVAIVSASMGAIAAWGSHYFSGDTKRDDVTDAQTPEDLRSRASFHAEKRNSYFAESQAAYRCGNRAVAKDLSEKGKAEQLLMEKYNDAAAMLYFERNNKFKPEDEIDLHGLFVKEAVIIVEKKIKQARLEKRKSLVFIVGVGNHSADGIVKLKPAIEKLITDYRLVCIPDKPNRGCLYVEIDSPNYGWFDNLKNGDCIIS